MKKIFMGALLVCAAQATYADVIYPAQGGEYVVPTSSYRLPSDLANHIQRSFNVYFKSDAPNASASPSSTCETPASLACVYGLTTQVPGCPISSTTALPAGISGNGGSGTTIGVVEGGDNENQLSDFNTYSTQFHLPLSPNPANPTETAGALNIYYCDSSSTPGATCKLASGVSPPPTPTQAAQTEHVLDIQMIHAMAPYATIDEVEAASQTNNDMAVAISYALALVKAHNSSGGGFVSDSYGAQEHSSETSEDAKFNQQGGILIASSGDYSAPATYPASSPYVIGAGASSVVRDANGNYVSQSAWNVNLYNEQIGQKSGTSGGPSLYESRPAFQNFVAKIVGTQRGTPDFSADGDPNTGVCVYSTYDGGWLKDGGTSAAAPQLAGILDTSAYSVTSTTTTQSFLTQVYENTFVNYYSNWQDIIAGNNGYPALAGYDFVTGLGTPLGYGGK